MGPAQTPPLPGSEVSGNRAGGVMHWPLFFPPSSCSERSRVRVPGINSNDYQWSDPEISRLVGRLSVGDPGLFDDIDNLKMLKSSKI